MPQGDDDGVRLLPHTGGKKKERGKKSINPEIGLMMVIAYLSIYLFIYFFETREGTLGTGQHSSTHSVSVRPVCL